MTSNDVPDDDEEPLVPGGGMEELLSSSYEVKGLGNGRCDEARTGTAEDGMEKRIPWCATLCRIFDVGEDNIFGQCQRFVDPKVKADVEALADLGTEEATC